MYPKAHVITDLRSMTFYSNCYFDPFTTIRKHRVIVIFLHFYIIALLLLLFLYSLCVFTLLATETPETSSSYVYAYLVYKAKFDSDYYCLLVANNVCLSDVC